MILSEKRGGGIEGKPRENIEAGRDQQPDEDTVKYKHNPSKSASESRKVENTACYTVTKV